jgi:putative toxin-antitoxin system antitoxin component (TIGR02293 family)
MNTWHNVLMRHRSKQAAGEVRQRHSAALVEIVSDPNPKTPTGGDLANPSATPLMSKLGVNLDSVEAGVSLVILRDFVVASGLEATDIYTVVIPARTLKHRKARKEALTQDESDKLVRLIRVYDQAVDVLGEKGRALAWLGEPKKRFEGRTPIQMLRTDLGGRMVEELLGQIYYGMFA